MCPDAVPQPAPKPVRPETASTVPADAPSSAGRENASPKTAGNPASEDQVGGGAPPVPEPSDDDDLLRLETFDWRRAVIIRLQNGRHPDPIIEALIKRRLDFRREDFVGPLPVRVLCTLAFTFLGCAVAWVVSWSVFSLLDLHGQLVELSNLMVTLLAALLGIAVFQPFRIYDEIGLAKKAQEKFEQLRQTVREARNKRRYSGS